MNPCTRSGTASGRSDVVLHLFGGLHMTVSGVRNEIPEGAHKLIAYVALNPRPVKRPHAAATLWPNVSERRALGNLRSVVWRLRSFTPTVLLIDDSVIRIADRVVVDVLELANWSSRVFNGTAADDDLAVNPELLAGVDLLPGWCDDWALFERERARQQTLHALEAMAARLCERQRFGEAMDAALIAIKVDPLRESAQRALIAVHLAEGNLIEAQRAFARFERILRTELGVEPSPMLQALHSRATWHAPRHGTRPQGPRAACRVAQHPMVGVAPE